VKHWDLRSIIKFEKTPLGPFSMSIRITQKMDGRGMRLHLLFKLGHEPVDGKAEEEGSILSFQLTRWNQGCRFHFLPFILAISILIFLNVIRWCELECIGADYLQPLSFPSFSILFCLNSHFTFTFHILFFPTFQ